MSDARFVPSGIVTFTTDFGMSDGYVGAMKGVVLRHAPGLAMFDVAHDVEPQNVAQGAVVLRAACPEFPEGTVHLAVIDPGVGTGRAGLVVLSGRHAFVGPDNGLFSLATSAIGGIVEARRIDATGALASVLAPSPSKTFHGRDVFAPTAAALASGHVAITDIGPPIEPKALEVASATRDPRSVSGHVTYVDHFGNLVTNVSTEDLAMLRAAELLVVVGGREVPTVTTYGDAEPDSVCALVGSEGFLEIAVRDGNAASTLGLTTGAPVRVVAQGRE